jgi:hypothetical protein
VRRTAIEKSGLQVRDPLRLLATPNSVVDETLRPPRSRRPSRRKVAELRVRVDGTETSLIVQVPAERHRGAFSGQVALMDARCASSRRTGLFDRIDVVPESTKMYPISFRCWVRLAGVATVQPSSAIGRRRGSLQTDDLRDDRGRRRGCGLSPHLCNYRSVGRTSEATTRNPTGGGHGPGGCSR